MRKFILILSIVCLNLMAGMAFAQTDDCGLQLSLGASHKLNKKFTVSAEGEMRTRNDFRTMDRWSLGIDGAYKLCKHAKLSAGYTLLYDNNIEKISGDAVEGITKWRPSYWGIRHRFNISLSGDVDWHRFTFSLRERWQYTFRPEKTVPRYDFDDEQWEDKTIKATSKNVLRSRLQVEYNIPKSKVDPYANVELFNAWSLQKVRYVIGADWKMSKKHTISAFYRYQTVNGDDDDNECNIHIVGVEYKFKF